MAFDQSSQIVFTESNSVFRSGNETVSVPNQHCEASISIFHADRRIVDYVLSILAVYGFSCEIFRMAKDIWGHLLVHVVLYVAEGMEILGAIERNKFGEVYIFPGSGVCKVIDDDVNHK
jgi:hypothetical protein